MTNKSHQSIVSNLIQTKLDKRRADLFLCSKTLTINDVANKQTPGNIITVNKMVKLGIIVFPTLLLRLLMK